MPPVWIVCLLFLPIIYLLQVCAKLRLNIRAAKASGLKYIVVPFCPYDRVTLTLTRSLFRLLDKISGEASPSSWRRLVNSGWLWKCRQATFAELGTDSFLIVAPSGVVMYTSDADVIAQIIRRDTDFPKAVALYKPINIYGPNIVSADGAALRRQRKIISQTFSERNNEMVWKETLVQTQMMLAAWLAGTDGKGKTIRQLADDTMRLSLSVISRAALGQRMDWSWGSADCDVVMDQEASDGHAMTFTYSLQYLLGHILYLMMFPRWVMRFIPTKVMRECYIASDELRRYMLEMISAKRIQLRDEKNVGRAQATDLLSQLLKLEDGKSATEKSGLSCDPLTLTESELVGNLFVFFIAGHETSANSIHFSLLLLAIHPETQKTVQQELDRLFQGRPMSSWDYKRDFPRLMNSLLGAVLSEQLRLITPVISIPKRVGSTPQPLTVDGREAHVPSNSIVRLCVHAVHRNPKFWPSGPPTDPRKPCFPPSNMDNDLEEFKPQRWLNIRQFPNATDTTISTNATATTSPYTTPLQYTLPRGAYLPFSAGSRACSGQRFAQVEILCALALILSQYSVELAVDAFASDERVAQMSAAEKALVWGQARDHATNMWQQKMQCVLTLQIRGGAHVPVRFVRRGLERFAEVEGKGEQ